MFFSDRKPWREESRGKQAGEPPGGTPRTCRGRLHLHPLASEGSLSPQVLYPARDCWPLPRACPQTARLVGQTPFNKEPQEDVDQGKLGGGRPGQSQQQPPQEFPFWPWVLHKSFCSLRKEGDGVSGGALRSTQTPTFGGRAATQVHSQENASSCGAHIKGVWSSVGVQREPSAGPGAGTD